MSFEFKKIIAAAGASSFLLGCGSEAGINPAELPQYQPSVLNGTIGEHSQFPSIAALTGMNGKDEICSGTLLKPDLVLTAAHCLYPKSYYGYRIVYGASDLVEDYKPENVFEIEMMARHPCYFSSSYSNEAKIRENNNSGLSYSEAGLSENSADDLGLILLKEEIPNAVTAEMLFPESYSEVLETGKILTVAGYGLDEEGQTGVLKYGLVPIIGRTEYEMHLGLDEPEAQNSCFGDSGGPTYIDVNGKTYLTGVTSRSPLDTAPECGHGFIVTLPGSYQNWIDRAYENLKQGLVEENKYGTSFCDEAIDDEVVPEGPLMIDRTACNYSGEKNNYCSGLFSLLLLYFARKRKNSNFF